MRFTKLFVALCTAVLVGAALFTEGAAANGNANHPQSVADGGAPLPTPKLVADGGAPLPTPKLIADGGAPLPTPKLVADGGAPLPTPKLIDGQTLASC